MSSKSWVSRPAGALLLVSLAAACGRSGSATGADHTESRAGGLPANDDGTHGRGAAERTSERTAAPGAAPSDGEAGVSDLAGEAER